MGCIDRPKPSSNCISLRRSRITFMPSPAASASSSSAAVSIKEESQQESSSSLTGDSFIKEESQQESSSSWTGDSFLFWDSFLKEECQLESSSSWIRDSRPHLREFYACQPILPSQVRSTRLARKLEDVVKLDANENPYGPPPEVFEALGSMRFPYIYPDPESRRLRAALANDSGIVVELDANENPYGPPPEVFEALGSMRLPYIYPDPESRRLRAALANDSGIVVELDANENPYGPPPEVFEALGSMRFPYIYPDPESRRLRAALANDSGIVVELDANENPYGPPPEVFEALGSMRFPYIYQALGSMRFPYIYPDPESRRLLAALANDSGIVAEYIRARRGADELKDFIMRCALEPGEIILDCPPTFTMYEFDAAVNGALVVKVIQGRFIEAAVDDDVEELETRAAHTREVREYYIRNTYILMKMLLAATACVAVGMTCVAVRNVQVSACSFFSDSATSVDRFFVNSEEHVKKLFHRGIFRAIFYPNWMG